MVPLNAAASCRRSLSLSQRAQHQRSKYYCACDYEHQYQALSPIGFNWHLLEIVEVEQTRCPAVSPQNPLLISSQEVRHSW